MNLNTFESANIGDRKASKRIRSCLRSVISEQPFFGNMCLKMPLVEDSKIETIAGNGIVFFYSPEWVNTNQADKIKFAMMRIVTGCALKHHTRRGERDRETWNKASFEACLPILSDSGYLDHDPEYQNRVFSNKSVEKIYNDIYMENPESDKGDDDGDGNQQDQGGGGVGDNSGDDSGAGPDSGDGESDSDGGIPDPEGHGVIMDAPADVDPKKEEQKWDENVSQAEQFSMLAGKDGGGHKERILGGSAKMNWQEILRHLLDESSKDDYSWTRPNRRYIHSGLYLPSLYSTGAMGSMVFAIDTSYSMSKKVLSEVWAEIRESAGMVKPSEIRVLQCDTQITSDESIDVFDMPEELSAKGRGGTNFKPVFNHINEMMDAPPKVLIYLTDLEVSETEYPDFHPDYPVIWAYYGEFYDRVIENRPESKVPFGETIRVDGK